MNRLIIIGNGFDLAHGIKSSFNDFITDYFCNAINTFYQKNSFNDIMLEINFKDTYRIFTQKQEPATKETVYKIIHNLNKNININFKFHSLLLENVYGQISKLKWVDLETEFFDVLIKTKISRDNESIKNVNSQLEFLKIHLVKYLYSQEKQFSNIFDKTQLVECFCEKIYSHEIVTVALDEDKAPENLYFLNFNYTKTIEDYIESCKNIIPSNLNYIHGNLSGLHGNPIFGFGDEFDKRYVEFEDDKNNDLFKHIKSFEYLKTKNYYLLTRFIESNEFQVQIYGHSCGISDRTMLNQIFEHINCKSIKIFYYKIDEQRNDFTDKTYEISRHFKDKTMLRKKLIPFDLSREMPQPMKS